MLHTIEEAKKKRRKFSKYAKTVVDVVLCKIKKFEMLRKECKTVELAKINRNNELIQYTRVATQGIYNLSE